MKIISEKENSQSLLGYTKAISKIKLTELFPDLLRQNKKKQA